MITVDKSIRHGSDGLTVTVEVHHYDTTASGSPAARRHAKRKARVQADTHAKVVSQTMRAYKGGAMPALAGASPLEFVGNNA